MDDDQRPTMRAVHMQSNIASLTLLGSARAAVLGRVSSKTVATIESAPRTAWLPLELDVELTEAIAAVSGVSAVRNWSRQALSLSLETPLLSGLLAALRVVGLSPRGVTRLAPTGWGAIYRGCGQLSRHVLDDATVMLTQEPAPDVMLQSAAYVEGIAGAFEVALDITHLEGACTVRQRDAEANRIVYELAFQP